MALDLHKKGHKKVPLYTPTRAEISKEIVNDEYPKDPLELLGERSFGSPKDLGSDEIGTPIQEFFRDKTVFLTGGTGFMGKTLVEKLLRCCPHVKHIYLLMRPKKGKDIQERLEIIFNDRLFWRLHTEVPGFLSKVSAVSGDCGFPGLGLGESDRALLISNVQVMFHGAATVRFDEHIKLAVKINVCGVQEILQLAKEMKQLQAFVHVSTAFTHCPRKEIDEEFYPVPTEYEKLVEMINSMDDDKLTEMTPSILGDWPNSYTFTKALAEQVVQKEGAGLPLAVLRPAVIISTYKEPVRGWIDNVYGPIGMMVGAGTGVLHTHLLDVDNVTDMVPVDMVVNALMAAAWSIQDARQSQSSHGKEAKEVIPIYNFVGSARNPISWRRFLDLNETHGIIWPTIRAVWYYSFYPVANKTLFFILSFFLHTIPGVFLDALLQLTGKKPMLCAIYDKIEKACETLEYFAKRRWVWTDRNVQGLFNKLDSKDKEMFFFDMGQLSWDYMCEALALGLRVYLVNDDIDTLPAARRKWRKLYFAHLTLKVISVTLLFIFFINLVKVIL